MRHGRDILVSFGQAVQEVRIERGLSQEDLAQIVGMHRTYLSDVERGVRNTSLASAKAIAGALGVSLASLVEVAEAEKDE